jgi:hypothetical protein
VAVTVGAGDILGRSREGAGVGRFIPLGARVGTAGVGRAGMRFGDREGMRRIGARVGRCLVGTRVGGRVSIAMGDSVGSPVGAMGDRVGLSCARQVVWSASVKQVPSHVLLPKKQPEASSSLNNRGPVAWHCCVPKLSTKFSDTSNVASLAIKTR